MGTGGQSGYSIHQENAKRLRLREPTIFSQRVTGILAKTLIIKIVAYGFTYLTILLKMLQQQADHFWYKAAESLEHQEYFFNFIALEFIWNLIPIQLLDSSCVFFCKKNSKILFC